MGMPSFYRQPINRMVVVTGLCLTFAGCSQDTPSTSKSGEQSGKPSQYARPEVAPDKMGDASRTPPPPQPTQPEKQQTMQTASNTRPAPDPEKIMDPSSPLTDDDRRAQAEDLIYATIRVKMEEAIASRAKMLREGRDPSDPQVRQLEGTIMRARDLLIEAGEVVEDVDPPIVQKAAP